MSLEMRGGKPPSGSTGLWRVGQSRQIDAEAPSVDARICSLICVDLGADPVEALLGLGMQLGDQVFVNGSVERGLRLGQPVVADPFGAGVERVIEVRIERVGYDPSQRVGAQRRQRVDLGLLQPTVRLAPAVGPLLGLLERRARQIERR